jgi:hypothetical protein
MIHKFEKISEITVRQTKTELQSRFSAFSLSAEDYQNL